LPLVCICLLLLNTKASPSNDIFKFGTQDEDFWSCHCTSRMSMVVCIHFYESRFINFRSALDFCSFAWTKVVLVVIFSYLLTLFALVMPDSSICLPLSSSIDITHYSNGQLSLCGCSYGGMGVCVCGATTICNLS